MEEWWRQADREPRAEEAGRRPNAAAKSKVTTQRVTVRRDQRAPDGRVQVNQSCSDVSGTDASKEAKSRATDVPQLQHNFLHPTAHRRGHAGAELIHLYKVFV